MKQNITRRDYYCLLEKDRRREQLSPDEQRRLRIGSGMYRNVTIHPDGTVSSCDGDEESERIIKEEYQNTFQG